MEELRKSGHVAKVVTLDKNDMMEIAVNVELERIEEFNKYQPNYLTSLPFDEANFCNLLDSKMIEESKYAYALMFCQKVSITMFPSMFPVFH